VDAVAITPIERRGEERRKRTVFGVLKCHGVTVFKLELQVAW